VSDAVASLRQIGRPSAFVRCVAAPVPASRIPSLIMSLYHPPRPYSPSMLLISRLEDHLVGVLTAPQAEAGAQVLLEVGLLLDCCHQRLVDSLLVRNALRVDILLLGCCLALLEEGILALALLLLTCPVLVLAHAVEDFGVEVRDIDRCAGCDYVAVVDAAQRDTVGLERSSNEENALVKLAQQDNALAGEATGEEDQDCAGLERLAVLGGVSGLAGLRLSACDATIFKHCDSAAVPAQNHVVVAHSDLAHTFFMRASSSAG
jgi:hypothetical protein